MSGALGGAPRLPSPSSPSSSRTARARSRPIIQLSQPPGSPVWERGSAVTGALPVVRAAVERFHSTASHASRRFPAGLALPGCHAGRAWVQWNGRHRTSAHESPSPRRSRLQGSAQRRSPGTGVVGTTDSIESSGIGRRMAPEFGRGTSLGSLVARRLPSALRRFGRGAHCRPSIRSPVVRQTRTAPSTACPGVSNAGMKRTPNPDWT